MTRIVMVLPTYDEALNLAWIVGRLHAAQPGLDVLVVDDGSSDRTGPDALAAGARVLRLPVNLGYGAALQAGYKYAVRHHYDLLGQIDADGQHLAEHFLPLLAHLGDHDVDVVIGSRFLDRDGHYPVGRGPVLPAQAFRAGAEA